MYITTKLFIRWLKISYANIFVMIDWVWELHYLKFISSEFHSFTEYRLDTDYSVYFVLNQTAHRKFACDWAGGSQFILSLTNNKFNCALNLQYLPKPWVYVQYACYPDNVTLVDKLKNEALKLLFDSHTSIGFVVFRSVLCRAFRVNVVTVKIYCWKTCNVIFLFYPCIYCKE